MIVNLTFSEVHELQKKLDTWKIGRIEEFIIAMPKAGLILDYLEIAMLGLEPTSIYKKMLEVYKNDSRALTLINETIKGNLHYRE